MFISCLLLLTIGALGAFDIAYFHHYRCQLGQHPSCRNEVRIHIARGVWYGAQFILVPRLILSGWMFGLVIAFFVVDVTIALTDVALEKKSRAAIGGLPTGEYVMHVVLSVLVGAFLFSYFDATGHRIYEAPAIAWVPAGGVPAWMHIATWIMGAGAVGCAIVELAQAIVASKPPPVHVRTRISAPLSRVWDLTQDHHEHPNWDHRFSKITMLDEHGQPAAQPTVKTGTLMKYERKLGPVTIHGWGRYKLHSPQKQSTFEFWSDDTRSLIRRGVGLWRYVEVRPGEVEFRTSYTYDVRWGLIGQLLDRVLLRKVMQFETERSFRRLLRIHFPEQAAVAVGSVGRRMAPWAGAIETAVKPIETSARRRCETLQH